MQRTRLNTLVEITGDRLELLFSNSWRRISLSLISILLGFFMGSALATTAGQAAVWDIAVAALVVIFAELISRLVYGRRNSRQDNLKPIVRSLYLDMLNLFKVGLMYNLFLEAFKLGS
jgi:positive regulator of sigma E activity